MAQLVLVVLAALAGLAGYTESVRYTKRTEKPLLWSTPWQLAAACGVVALVLAFFAGAIVVAALLGLTGFRAAERFKGQSGEALLDLPSLAWAGAAAFLGFMSAALTSTATGAVVAAFLALGAALLVLRTECLRLVAENKMWMSENRRLLAEKSVKQPAATTAAAAPAPAAPAAPAPGPAPAASAPRAGSPYRHLDLAPPPAAPAPAPAAPAPAARFGNGVDMLPRR